VRVDGLDPGTAVRLRAAARRQLGAHPDVKLAPGDQGAAAARAVLAAPGTWGYRVDATVVRVEQLPQGLRAEVSAVLQTYPGRDIRAQVRGAATVPGSSDAAARRQAVDAALRSALRQLPGVMARVSH
jgi:VCBS repeat-containing protein